MAELVPNDVQMIPARVDSQTDSYFIMNVLRIVKCIDDAACEEVHYWRPEDDEPELLGKYRGVLGLRIDTSKVGEARIFRTAGWEVAVIVSEDIKQAMERLGVRGAKFMEVG